MENPKIIGQIEDKSGQWMEFAENSERNDER